jgi:hypothetical protein
VNPFILCKISDILPSDPATHDFIFTHILAIKTYYYATNIGPNQVKSRSLESPYLRLLFYRLFIILKSYNKKVNF